MFVNDVQIYKYKREYHDLMVQMYKYTLMILNLEVCETQ